jgi:hypothetical protein
MAIQPISNVTFQIDSDKPSNKYSATISFWDQSGSLVSKKVFYFAMLPTGSNEGITVDIASINGFGIARYTRDKHKTDKLPALLKKACSDGDVKDIQSTIQLPEVQEILTQKSAQVVIVLDLKDQKGWYENTAQISEAEKTVELFLQHQINLKDSSEVPPPVQQVRGQLDQISQPVYMICEGSMKCELTGHFSPDQMKYFKDSGKHTWCQVAELFINALKFNAQVSLGPNGASPIDFREKIVCIHGDLSPKPARSSTVVYPPPYLEIARNGVYTAAMKASTAFQTVIRERGDFTLIGLCK